MGNSDIDPDEIQSNLPALVAAARWLFILLGVIWLLFGAWSITRMSVSSGNLSSTMLGIITILMFFNAALLIWFGWRTGKGQKLYYYFGVLVLAGNIILTLTDEFGIFDLIVLILVIGLMVLLIFTRSMYLTN